MQSSQMWEEVSEAGAMETGGERGLSMEEWLRASVLWGSEMKWELETYIHHGERLGPHCCGKLL